MLKDFLSNYIFLANVPKLMLLNILRTFFSASECASQDEVYEHVAKINFQYHDPEREF